MALCLGLACLPAAIAPATVAAAPASDAATFDQLFKQGADQYANEDYLTAARTWTEAARRLPADDRENRRVLYDEIAEAYERAAGAGEDQAVVAEAVRVLDDYARAFGEAFSGAQLGQKGTDAHAKVRGLLATKPVEGPEPPPGPTDPTPAPQARPWKGLAIGGGVTAGLGLAMFGMFAGGYVRTQSFERQFSEDECSSTAPSSDCQDILDRGDRADAIAVTGLVAGPVLLAAGATMIGLAIRRKSSQQSFAPALGGGMLGAVWRGRF